MMTTTHDDELRESLHDPIREFSIKLTVPSTMTGKVPENLYEIESELEESLVQIVKARELAARKESAQRLQQKITRYGDGVIAYHNGEATVPMSAVLEELVGLKSHQQKGQR